MCVFCVMYLDLWGNEPRTMDCADAGDQTDRGRC